VQVEHDPLLGRQGVEQAWRSRSLLRCSSASGCSAGVSPLTMSGERVGRPAEILARIGQAPRSADPVQPGRQPGLAMEPIEAAKAMAKAS
jgi:hypothetical protein